MDKFEIKGKVNTAICYAKVAEEEAIEQIRRMCNYECTRGSQIRIMPDVHAGKGATIGTTMTIEDKAVPNMVGVDIGCGMYTVNLGKEEIDLKKLDEAAHFIPSGKQIWEENVEYFDLTNLKCFSSLSDIEYFQRSLGTLGGGNHFVEVDRAKDGTNYLIIHSGSRKLGKCVAEYYQNLAIELHSGKDEYLRKRQNLIEEYKAVGRNKEILAALKQITWNKKESEIPNDLCYLYGEYFEDYLYDVEICQEFARKNRETMAKIIMERIGRKAWESWHTIHNYIDVEEKILRKGAIAAHKGEKVLIPINMHDGSILAVGIF